MQIELTPLVWQFVVSLLITSALGLHARRLRHLPSATTFAWLMLALSYWTLCYAMELLSATLPAKVFWAGAKYPGSTAGPALWFVLALELTGRQSWLRAPLRAVLWTFCIVTTAVVWTNALHHWYWTGIRIVPGEPETQVEHGFFFLVNAAGMYAFIVSGTALFFSYYRAAPRWYRRQATALGVAGFIPLAGRMLEDFAGVDLFPHVDNVILLLLASGVLYALAIFRYGALSVVHIAHSLVIQNIRAGIVVLDTTGRVVELNPYACALLGLDNRTAIGQPLGAVFADEPPPAPGDSRELVVSQGGTRTFIDIQSSPIRQADGSLAGQALVLFDVTGRKNAEQQLEALAKTDALTGVANRRQFFELAETEVARCRRYGRPLAILMLDIDHFKAINDRYGHQEGDEVLRRVASACQQDLRTTDTLARYGGEEFVCLLGESSEPDARATAERLRQLVEGIRMDSGGQTKPVTISLGMAWAESLADTTLAELIGRADRALYQSKERGRNRVTVWAGPDG